jgi:hypothetical protein
MGQVGGNGSVVWQNQHRLKRGKFKCKDRAKLQRDELGLGNALDVWGYDDVPHDEIGTTRPADLESDLKDFQREKHFLVRLRFEGDQADAIRNLCGTGVEGLVKVVNVGTRVILAINVQAIERKDWPNDDVSWSDPPFEIRYDW